VGFSATHPHQDYQRTVATTAAVLEFVRLYAKDAAVVYPSSAAVYGYARRLPIAETEAPSPVSAYGVHKQMAEQLCAAYARHFGIKAAIVRLFSVYGNGLRKQLLWDACSKLRRGEAEFFGTGAELRDWLHVEDAATLLALARRHASTACPVVNGGSGAGVAVADIVQEIRNAMHADVAVTFDGKVRDVDPPTYVADVNRAAAWGWRARKPWQEGVRAYAGWFASAEN
jgi:UDP-glucose 4-epimerase